ncbi:MAG: hypothetical protein IJT34_00820 [Butyrivibrio sp.]|nr:hypothetical protein [Butyrivibrio sp.]
MVSSLTLRILKGYARPVVSLKGGLTCLIDSGADTPVWTKGAERLCRFYNAEKVMGKKFLLSGFGNGYEIIDVYKVSDVDLIGVDKNGTEDKITFINLIVGCTTRPSMIADLILPNTAFSHMNLILRNLDVQYPIVEVEHDKTDYYVNPIYRADDDRFVDRVYSFTNI